MYYAILQEVNFGVTFDMHCSDSSLFLVDC